MKVAVVVPRPPGYSHRAALLDLAVPLYEGLKACGVDAELVDDWKGFDRAVIVGPHLLNKMPPSDAILYNTEQVSPESMWFSGSFLELCRRHDVWDYDPLNTIALQQLGIAARTVPPGHVPRASLPDVEKDVDILFFGSLNERRFNIINRLADFRDVSVRNYFGLYGAERDEACAHAKIVLNVHFYESKIFEAARVSYLLASRCFVVTEESTCMPWAGGYVAVPYDRLADTCVEYLEKPDERQRIATAGLEIFSKCTAADMVREAAADL